MSDHDAKQATPHADLIAQIRDSRIPKNEREWAAAREIERLESALAEAQAAPAAEPVVWQARFCGGGGFDQWFDVEERFLNRYAKKAGWEVRALGVIAPPPVEASQQQQSALGITSGTISRTTSEWCESYACEKLGGVLQEQRCLQSDGDPCFCWRAAGE